jgi:hypothetical protein
MLELRKEDYFSEAGKIPKQVGFVVKGVVRGCYYNSPGGEISRCFISESSQICDYVNFDANTPSSEHLQAIKDCKLIIFSKKENQLDKSEILWVRFTTKYPLNLFKTLNIK